MTQAFSPSMTLEELNADSSALNLGVGSTRNLVDIQAKDIPATQQIREFLHNSLNAVATLVQAGRTPSGTVNIDLVERNGVHKLAFIDNGCGMTAQDLRDLIGQLASSANAVGDSRFGLGAKLTGLYNNKLGIEYTTLVDGANHAVRGTLGLDTVTQNYCWLKNSKGKAFTKIDRSSLPALMSKTGHGTMVVLLGNIANDDTFANACGIEGNKNRRLAKHVNGRYLEIPPSIHVRVRGTQSGSAKNPAKALQTITGMLPALQKAALEENQGIVELPSGIGRVSWFYVTESTQVGTTVRNEDEVIVRRAVAVCLPDAEIEGLVEIYDLQTGQTAQRSLAIFGLADIAARVALVLEPTGVRAEAGRTGLRVAETRKPFTVYDMAEEFKAVMPERLAELVEQQIASKPLGNSDRLLDWMKTHSKLFSIAQVRKGLGSGFATATTRVRNLCDLAGSNRPTAAKPKASASRRANGQVNGVSSDENSAGFGIELPTISVLTEGDFAAEPHLVAFAGRYAVESNTLFVNEGWEKIDREVADYTDGRKLSDAEYRSARKVVSDHIVDRMRESIIHTKALAVSYPQWADEASLAIAYSEAGITMAAMSAFSGASETSRAVTRAIGSTAK